MSTNYQSLTWRQMSEFHQNLRIKIFNRVEKRYKQLGVNASEISFQHANTANSWKEHWRKPNRAASWDWVELYNQYQARSAARRFDMALSNNGNLVALCYGMMERDRLILKLHAIERSPLSNNVISGYVLDINLFAADLYAQLNGTQEIWICNPVSPVHVRMYSAKGYVPQENHYGKVTHLMTRL